MNEKRDYYYKILGLQPGAAPGEVKAAYRKLVKFYHPDRCQSPDTEMMYREIYTAYKALLEQPITGKASSESIVNRYTSEWTVHTDSHTKKARQSTTDSRDLSEQATWTSEDWEIWEREHFSKHFREERKNKLSNIRFSNVFFAFALVCLSFGPPILLPRRAEIQSYSELVVLYHTISWFFFIFFRYYFTPSNWSFFLKFVTGILHGAILVFLITCFYVTSGVNLFWTGFLTTASAWVLMADFHIPWRRMY